MSPRTFTISAHSLGIYDRCSRAYLYYKVHGRKAVRSAAGLIAGTALHEGISLMTDGQTTEAQEQAMEAVLRATPTPVDDYRSSGYLREALAAFRAEFADIFRGWRIEEREVQGVVVLGMITAYNRQHESPPQPWGDDDSLLEDWLDAHRVQVLWEFRRDLVGIDPDGRRYIVDWKTASRNEDAQYLAYKNSGQFMGYLWSWNQEHPDRPALGVLPVRIILRKPTKTGTMFEFPKDAPILFQPERLEEWRRHTLFKIEGLLARPQEDPDYWPLAAAELGCCRHTYGCCDYLPVCCMKPGEDRERLLASDAYEPADSGKITKPPTNHDSHGTDN